MGKDEDEEEEEEKRKRKKKMRERERGVGTMVQNRKKHRTNSHPIIHFPTSEGVSKVSEQANE